MLTTNAPRTRWMSSASLPACQPASPSPAIQLPKPDTVKPPLTPKRPRRQVENGDYGAFARRVLRAYARRVGDGDVEALILMTSLAGEIDTAIAGAVQGLRACGYSWAEIGSRVLSWADYPDRDVGVIPAADITFS